MQSGWSPKIPKRPNFRFSPDVWVVPNEKIWASAQKIERGGGGPPFLSQTLKTYLNIAYFYGCRTILCRIKIDSEQGNQILHGKVLFYQ